MTDFRGSSWCTQNQTSKACSWQSSRQWPQLSDPFAQATPGALKELCILGLDEDPKNFIAPNRGPHREAALQESVDVSLEKHEQLSGWGPGGGAGVSKRKKKVKGETPPAVCWERVADSFISENFPVRDLYIGICRQVTL